MIMEDAKHTIDVVRFFLEREPAAPFSFYITLYRHVEDYQQADRLSQIMEMLVDESMRWKKASFDIDAQGLSLLARTKDHLPLLQRLYLSQSSNEGFPDLLYNIFQNAPSLYSVHIGNLANWKFNWSNLKNLNMRSLPGSRASEFIAALPQMTKLEHLKFDCEYSDAIPSSTVVLPSLAKLSCRPGWLRFMQAPAMKNLEIDYNNDATSDSPDIVLSFLHRSCSALKLLRLSISSAQASTVVEIIRHTPRLTYLSLSDIANPGDVFEQLIIPIDPAQEPLVPHLQALSFCDEFICDYDMNLLFYLISSRSDESATGNCDHGRLQKLEMLVGDMDSVSFVTKVDLIALCEERGIQYVEE
ncbi:hypothetical protein APHAL10511_000912 [Amanita phalloides]|nr:hypothetical protein APHAL10511_000912 [Amanita phalloides]